MTLKRTPLKRSQSINKISNKQKIKNKEKAENTKKLHEWFISVWDEREEVENDKRFVTCFETGKRLSREYYRENSCCYHHLILKSKRPDLAFEPENLVIITPEVHSQTHVNIDKTPKIKELTKLINQKFGS